MIAETRDRSRCGVQKRMEDTEGTKARGGGRRRTAQWYLNQANQTRRPAGKLSNSDATPSSLQSTLSSPLSSNRSSQPRQPSLRKAQGRPPRLVLPVLGC